MFSAHTIHVLHVVLRDTLIFLIILFFALFAWLLYGIQTDKLTFGQYEVDGLYIKLDKKLTLTADKIIIPQSKEKPSFDNVDKTFDRIKNLFTYFDYIDLKEIDFKNNTFHFLFTDNVLYITSNDYEVAGNIERRGQRLIADVSLLYIKKEKINIVGKLKYFLNKDRLETEGAFEAYNITGNFALYQEDDKISFAAKSDDFTDLKTLTKRLPVKEVIKPWIADRLEAESYKLHTLVGKANIVDKKLKLDINSLHGNATLKNVKIDFKDKLAPVLAKEVRLRYENRSLFFDLDAPTYKKRDLNGSKVSITNMGKGKVALLNLDLHVKSQVDATVSKLLKAYNVHIPVTQKGKNVSAHVQLDVPLKKTSKSAKEKANHKVKVMVDARLPKGEITINKTLKFPVSAGKVHYEKGVITLKNIHVKERWYGGRVNGHITLKNKVAQLKADIDYLTLGEKKNPFFKLKKKNLGINIDYGRQMIDVPALKVKMLKEKKKFRVQLQDLKRIKPYLKGLPLEMDGGHLDVVTRDFTTFSYVGSLKRNACFFYSKNNVCYTQVPCKGSVSKNQFTLQAFNDRLKIDLAKSLVRVNNLNIDLKMLFDSINKKNTASSSSKLKRITILGKKSNIRYKEYTLKSDHYKIVGTTKGNISAEATLGKDKVIFKKQGAKLKIEAIRISDKLLHPLINFNGLQHGRYTFKAYGNPDKVMHGEIVIEGGVMKDFKAYNNTLAFINTLPALATLHNPGYSKKGFTIKHGVAKYRKIKDKIIFDSIYIKGTSADFVGKGEINLKKNTINVTIAIQTARELGKVIGSIPLLGYILMGDDKSMTVGLKITGSLKKPVVKTSATKEILKLPLDLIKRTLTSPAHILNKAPKEKKPKAKSDLFNKVAP